MPNVYTVHNKVSEQMYTVHKEQMKVAGKVQQRVRKTFRHGDLRRALLEAGMELARVGGPGAVVLREATRRVGVTPNAAYRHFASHGDLLRGVRADALARLAVGIEAEMAKVRSSKKPGQTARAMLRAVGKGYLKFALAEAGLFRTAFSVTDPVEGDLDAAKAGQTGLNPYQLLGLALDTMVEAGVLPAERRGGAEYLAWSAVHGFAFLILDGPLHSATEKEIESLAGRLLEMVEKGL